MNKKRKNKNTAYGLCPICGKAIKVSPNKCMIVEACNNCNYRRIKEGSMMFSSYLL